MPLSEEQAILDLALSKGLIGRADLAECEEVQASIRRMGAERGMLDLLLDRGRLTPEGLENLKRELGLEGDAPRSIGPYEVVRPLGGGASGSVYLARKRSALADSNKDARMHEKTESGEYVAVKVLRVQHVDDPRYLDLFERETEAIRSLDHPNIVRGYESGWGEGFRYFAMEYVDGPTLRDIVRSRGRLSERPTARIGARLAAAVEYLDSRGVAHCDIKPGNVIIRRDGTLKLSDLGSARLYDSPPGMRGRELIMATPNYMAPEFFRARRAPDCRTDLYSVGATLYYCLTGQPPHGRGTPAEVAKRAAAQPPAPLRQMSPEVSPEMEQLVFRLVARDPAKRPRHPAGVRRALVALAKR